MNLRKLQIQTQMNKLNELLYIQRKDTAIFIEFDTFDKFNIVQDILLKNKCEWISSGSKHIKITEEKNILLFKNVITVTNSPVSNFKEWNQGNNLDKYEFIKTISSDNFIDYSKDTNE